MEGQCLEEVEEIAEDQLFYLLATVVGLTDGAAPSSNDCRGSRILRAWPDFNQSTKQRDNCINY